MVKKNKFYSEKLNITFLTHCLKIHIEIKFHFKEALQRDIYKNPIIFTYIYQLMTGFIAIFICSLEILFVFILLF